MNASIVPALSLLGLACLAPTLSAQPSDTPGKRVEVVQPEKQVREAQTASIDTERFELGAFLGVLSVEDFGSEPVVGLELSYHLTQRWLLQGSVGEADIDRAAFEETSQGNFLASSDRDFQYVSVGGGYRFLTGRSFWGDAQKFETALYAVGAIEQVDFAGNSETGFAFGVSYRVVLTDWLTANLDFREHSVRRDFIGDDKQTFNTELRFGLNALF